MTVAIKALTPPSWTIVIKTHTGVKRFNITTSLYDRTGVRFLVLGLFEKYILILVDDSRIVKILNKIRNKCFQLPNYRNEFS